MRRSTSRGGSPLQFMSRFADVDWLLFVPRTDRVSCGAATDNSPRREPWDTAPRRTSPSRGDGAPFHEPSRTEAGKLVTGNLSLVIGHLEGDTAKRRLRQSPITSDQLPVTSYQ